MEIRHTEETTEVPETVARIDSVLCSITAIKLAVGLADTSALSSAGVAGGPPRTRARAV